MEMEPVEEERIFPTEDQEAELGEGNSILGVPEPLGVEAETCPPHKLQLFPLLPERLSPGWIWCPTPPFPSFFFCLRPSAHSPWGFVIGSLLVSHLRGVDRKPQ